MRQASACRTVIAQYDTIQAELEAELANRKESVEKTRALKEQLAAMKASGTTYRSHQKGAKQGLQYHPEPEDMDDNLVARTDSSDNNDEPDYLDGNDNTRSMKAESGHVESDLDDGNTSGNAILDNGDTSTSPDPDLSVVSAPNGDASPASDPELDLLVASPPKGRGHQYVTLILS